VSESKIRRKFKSFPILLSSSEQGSVAIRVDDVAGGAIRVGTSAASQSSLQVWGSDDVGGSFGRLRKVDGTAVDITLSPSTAVSSVYPIPDEVFGCGAIKLVSATTHSASAIVMLKT